MKRQALTELSRHGAFGRMVDLINQRQQKLDDLLYRLERAERQIFERNRRRWELAAAAVRHYDVRRMLAGIRQELDARVAAMAAGARNLLLQRRSRWERLAARLEGPRLVPFDYFFRQKKATTEGNISSRTETCAGYRKRPEICQWDFARFLMARPTPCPFKSFMRQVLI